MLFRNFEQHIQLAQQNLNLIQSLIEQEYSDSANSTPALLIKTLSQLSIALEELHIVTEELQQQKEEMIATRLELEKERLSYQDLFQLAPDGYLVTDPKGVIRQANHAIETMLGVRSDRLVGKPLIVFIPENERLSFQIQLNKLTLEKTLPKWSINLKPRQGQPFSVEISIAMQKDNQGNVERLLWSIRNT